MRLAELLSRRERRPLASAFCLFFGLVGLLAVGTPAAAQMAFGPAGGGLGTVRDSWQQRVLGGTGKTSQRHRQGHVWGPVQNVSIAPTEGDMLEAGTESADPVAILPDGSPVGNQIGPEALVAPSDYGPCATCGGGSFCGDPGGGCFAACGPAGCVTRPWLHHIALFLGVQGFKGPVDRGINGDFGFNEGLNWSAELGPYSLVGYQVGFRAVQSNFDGDQVLGFRDGSRDQMFLTAGLFRRAPCTGWQGGVAYDYLHDRYYYGSVDLGQLRAELSWLHFNRWDVGFWGAIGTAWDEGIAAVPVRLEPTDLYAFFYRQHFGCGGTVRLWAGFTGQGDGLVGANLAVPLGRGWALENNFNYLAPNESGTPAGQREESWGVAIRLVWYPGRDAGCELQSPFHALFDVADNSVFMVDFR